MEARENTLSATQVHEMILNAPALSPPPDVIPNFVDPPNLRNDPLTISLLLISTIVVWVRLWTKWRIVRKLVLEDYCLLVAWLIYTAAFHYFVFEIHLLPTGVHQWNLKIKDLIRGLKLFHYAEITYALSIVPLKAAIILQCLRVFVPSGIRDLTFWACHILLWANAIFYITVIFVEAFSCNPREAIWDVTIEGKCLDRLSLHYISAAFNSVSDICVLILLQRAIWGLQTMNRKRKWGLSALFLLGAFACASSTVRLYYTVKLYQSDDVSYHMGLMGIWTEPELTCGFVAASAPVIPRFLKDLKKRWPLKYVATAFKRNDSSGNEEKEVQHQQQDNKDPVRKMISDLEFHELVIKTDGTETTMGSEEIMGLKDENDANKIARTV